MNRTALDALRDLVKRADHLLAELKTLEESRSKAETGAVVLGLDHGFGSIGKLYGLSGDFLRPFVLTAINKRILEVTDELDRLVLPALPAGDYTARFEVPTPSTTPPPSQTTEEAPTP